MIKLFKKGIKYVKSLIGVKEPTCEALKKEDYIDKEINRVETSLVDLKSKIQGGLSDLDHSIDASMVTINRHRDLLHQTKNKHAEYINKNRRVSDLLSSIEKIK